MDSDAVSLMLDSILCHTGLVFAIILVAWWGLRSRRDPLSNAPCRQSDLREDALMVAILAYMTTWLVLAGVLGTEGDGVAAGGSLAGSQPAASLVAGCGAQIAGLAACLILAARQFEGGARRFCFGQGPMRPGLLVSFSLAVFVLAAGLCPIVLETTVVLLHWFDPHREFPVHSTISALRDPAQPIFMVAGLWISAVLLAPVAEELFFRGLLQTVVVNITRSRWAAISIASLAFALVHLQQPYAMPALGLLSVLLGFAYERTGSLLPPIAIHALFNLRTLVWNT